MLRRTRALFATIALLSVASCDLARDPTAGRGSVDELQAALQAAPAADKVRVIVRLRGMGEARGLAATLNAPAAAGNSRVLRQYNNFPLLAVQVNANAVEALRRAPGVLAVTSDVLDPPLLATSLGVINADDVHALGWDGDGWTVAILDTGIDQDHPFLAGRIVAQACFSTGGEGHDDGASVGRISLCPGNAESSLAANAADTDIVACDNNGDLCDHGTHVAGIAAGNGAGLAMANAQAAGVAPGANIIAIQVFTRFNRATDCSPGNAPCVRSYLSDHIAGMDHVLTLRNTFNIAAVNMSLGAGNFTSACDASEAARKTAIDALLAADIATVISSGNNNVNNAVAAPACISTAVTVGATDNSDAVTRNRGPLLDLFAPGSGIVSSGSDGGFEAKGGTSMAAPHVTGAWAVMRQALPTASVADILERLQTTGLPITYTSGSGDATTPRIDLLAALQTTAAAPTITVNSATVTVNEGQVASNGGTFAGEAGPVSLSASVGTVVDQGGGTWSWTFATSDGPAQNQTVTITATDQLHQETGVSFQLVVNNVAPSVSIAAGQVMSIVEGTALTVSGEFTDPGVLDTHTATVTCHSVGGPQNVAGQINITSVHPVRAGTVTATCPYGDRSAPTFAVTISVVDKDNGQGSASFNLTVANVAPVAAIDKSGATLINGVPTIIAQIGVPLTFEGNATDPGSDDIQMRWNWADGNFTSTMYRANPPGADPLPSPDMNPRDVNDSQAHTWVSACMFNVSLTATDDDGGAHSDAIAVIIGGNSRRSRSMGYWQTEFRGRTGVFTSATLDCYLSIARFMSAVFDEAVDASTQAKAAQVLFPRGQSTMAETLDAQLLAAWLNFANGAFGWSTLVDTNGDKVADTPFSTAVMAAEAVRLNPLSTKAQLEAQKNILESINVMHP